MLLMTAACDSPGASQHEADTHANESLQSAEPAATPGAAPGSPTTPDRIDARSQDKADAKSEGTDEEKAAAKIQVLYHKHAERRARQGMQLFKRPEKVRCSPLQQK